MKLRSSQFNIFLQHAENTVRRNIEESDKPLDDKTAKILKQREHEEEQKGAIKGEIASGIQGLDDHLLPHFTMLLVGKPGSGKSTLMKNLIEDPALYADKFDTTLVISPSISKLELQLPEDDQFQEFDFNWIFDKIFEINRKQLKVLQEDYIGTDLATQHSEGQKKKKTPDNQLHVFNQVHDKSFIAPARVLNHNNIMSMNDHVQHMMQIYTDRQPFSLNQISSDIMANSVQDRMNPEYSGFNGGIARTMPQIYQSTPARVQKKRDIKHLSKHQTNQALKNKVKSIQEFSDKVHGLYKKHIGSKEEMVKTHKNILLILDDVVGELNQFQHHYALAKLFLNRRHLIANATISIILSTQKYTMIPARIRSNSNWMILFRLNPVDFETVRVDATSLKKKNWDNVLKFVFGEKIVEEGGKLEAHFVEGQEEPDNYDFLSLHINGNKNRMFKVFQEFSL